MRRLPRKLEALARVVNFTLIFDAFAGSRQLDDVDIFARAPQRLDARRAVSLGALG
jgi:hypothetical protein